MKLLPHQVIGRDFLVAHKRALLADGMRVGKSVQTIAACDVLSEQIESTIKLGEVMYQPKLDVTVICPSSLREQWRRQFDQFQQHTVDLTVVSYEQAVKTADELAEINTDVLVLDEAHYLKSRDAKRTKAVFDKIVPNAKRVWCLTGTPCPNNASELYPMLKALFPETIARPGGSAMNFWQFTNKFCVVERTVFGDKIAGNKNADDLRARLAPIMLRRPSSILGNVVLPPETLYLDAAADVLKKLERDLREEFGDAKLDPETIDDKVRARISRLTGLAKVPVLAARLRDEFESGLDKVVVFAWHKDVIDALTDYLPEFYPAVLTGSTGMAFRMDAIDRFQSTRECRIFIGNIKAAGVGLDLSAACELIFLETSWVPGDNEQAAMRIMGVNQKRAARVRYAVLPGSVDERLMAVNRRKMKDIQELLGDAA